VRACALANLFIGWLGGTLAVDRDTLTDFCVRLLVTAAAALPGNDG